MILQECGLKEDSMSDDQGHEDLIDDVQKLLLEVDARIFHDFDSDLPTPKMFLVTRLQTLIDNVKNGKYDN